MCDASVCDATVRGSHRLSAEGREGRSQGGPKGHRLEVGGRRAPKLLVDNNGQKINNN